MRIRTLAIEASPFKLSKTFAEIWNDKVNINSGIFREYFRYQNPSFLAKDLLKANQIKNPEILNEAFYSWKWKSKTIGIAEKVLSFNNQWKGQKT